MTFTSPMLDLEPGLTNETTKMCRVEVIFFKNFNKKVNMDSKENQNPKQAIGEQIQVVIVKVSELMKQLNGNNSFMKFTHKRICKKELYY